MTFINLIHRCPRRLLSLACFELCISANRWRIWGTPWVYLFIHSVGDQCNVPLHLQEPDKKKKKKATNHSIPGRHTDAVIAVETRMNVSASRTCPDMSPALYFDCFSGLKEFYVLHFFFLFCFCFMASSFITTAFVSRGGMR